LNVPNKILKPNEKFSITPEFTSDEKTNLSAIIMDINFDALKLTFKGVSPVGKILSGEIKSEQKGNGIKIIYLTHSKGVDIENGEVTSLFKVDFKANENLDNTKISAVIDSISNIDEKSVPFSPINPIELSTSESLEEDCSLKMLEAVNAKLEPEFSPDILNYSTDVPSTRITIEFNAEATDPEATVTVSGNKLKEAGKTTKAIITVSSKDKKVKKNYEVLVNRMERELVGSANPLDEEHSETSKPTKSDSKLGKSKSYNSSENVKESNKLNPVKEQEEPKLKQKSEKKKSEKNKKAARPVAQLNSDENDITTIEPSEEMEPSHNVGEKNSKLLVEKENLFVPLFYCVTIIILVVLFFLYRELKPKDKDKALEPSNDESQNE
jgi:hypothetical protein